MSEVAALHKVGKHPNVAELHEVTYLPSQTTDKFTLSAISRSDGLYELSMPGRKVGGGRRGRGLLLLLHQVQMAACDAFLRCRTARN
jgi:hypothetical protein